jgi:hypothetical protein
MQHSPCSILQSPFRPPRAPDYFLSSPSPPSHAVAAEKNIEMMEPIAVDEVVVHVEEAPAVVMASRADPVRASSPAFFDLAEDEEEESMATKAVPSYLKPTAAYVARSKATPETIPEVRRAQAA